MDEIQRLRIYQPDEEDLVEDAAACQSNLAPRTGIAVHLETTEGNSTSRAVASRTTDNMHGITHTTKPDSTPASAGLISQDFLGRFMLFTGYVVVISMVAGCSAFRPLHGIPVRQVPPEFRGVSRANMETIDLSRLSQLPRGHFVDSGDLLGVYVYGILGKENEAPPVYVPQTGDGNPTIGLPIPVRDDGTISLPQIPPLFVRGMTVRQVEEAVRREYVSRGIRENGMDILVSLQRSRSYKVTVLRQETANPPITGLAGGGIQLGATKRGTGQVVTLPAGENDVLRALTLSGGLPGLDAQNAIYVLRRPQQLRQVPAATPFPMPLSKRNAPRAGQSQVILTSGTTDSGGRYDTDYTSGDGQYATSPRSGFSTPTSQGWTARDSQDSPQFEAGNIEAAPWNPGPQAARPGRSSRGAGYSSPNPNELAANQEVPEALPEPLYSRDDSGIPGRPYDHVDTGSNIPEQTPIVAAGNQYIPPELQPYMMSGAQVFRIPVRLRQGEQAYFNENDIMLYNGDIIFIESRETEIFYTGGLLGGGQYSLPRDYDLDVIDAISIAQGSGTAGAAGGGAQRLGGITANNQDISVSASRLIIIRRLADGRRVNIKVDINKALRDENENILVQPGDHLILRYTPVEAVAAFFERHLLAGALIGLASQTPGLGGSQ